MAPGPGLKKSPKADHIIKNFKKFQLKKNVVPKTK